MKKLFLVFCIMVFSVLLIQAPAQAQSKFGFKVSGGLLYAGGGDLNTGVQGWSDFYSALMRLLGYNTITGGYNPLHLGLDIQGEFLFHVSPAVALGLGVGYLSAAKDSTLTGAYGSSSASITWQPKATAIPITFNFHYYIPAGGALKFVLNAGAGYYLTKIGLTTSVSGGNGEKYDVSAGGFGFHGGVGLDLALSRAVSLVLDLMGRYATASGFTGSYTSGSTTETNGKLYFYEATITNIGVLPILTYDTSLPSGSGVGKAREAKLDLSGFSAVFGFVFHF